MFCAITILYLCCFYVKSDEITSAASDAYLKQFGYLTVPPQQPGRSADVNAAEAQRQKEKALKLFQSFAGIPATGKLDDSTKAKMLSPRCSLADFDGLRRGRVNIWDKPVVTWKIKEFSRKMSQEEVRQTIMKAFDVWAKVIPVDFLETHPQDKSDMEVKFARLLHDDPYAFDGPGHTLAHAFYPKDGRVHFDDDEKWSVNNRGKIANGGYTDFLSVAVHEFGHSLGLTHVSAKDSIMLPYYVIPDEQGPRLSQGDIQKIQSLYGSRKGPPPKQPPIAPSAPPPPKPTPSSRKTPPDEGQPAKSCPDRINAATTAMNGKNYFFKDNTLYQTAPSGKGLIESPIDMYFPKFKGPVDAAVTTTVSQLTLLFQGRKLFAYEWDNREGKFDLHPDFPKNLPQEVPFVPESAFRWTDGNTILTNGDDFATYDENYNKPTLKHKMSAYFSGIPRDSIGIFSLGEDIFIVDKNSKINTYKNIQQRKSSESQSLTQLLRC